MWQKVFLIIFSVIHTWHWVQLETLISWDSYFSFVMRSSGRTVTLSLVTVIFIIQLHAVTVQTRSQIFIATNPVVLRQVQNQRQLRSVEFIQHTRQARSYHKKQEVEVKEIPVKRKRGPSCLFRCLRFGKLHPAQCHMMCWKHSCMILYYDFSIVLWMNKSVQIWTIKSIIDINNLTSYLKKKFLRSSQI